MGIGVLVAVGGGLCMDRELRGEDFKFPGDEDGRDIWTGEEKGMSLMFRCPLSMKDLYSYVR